MPDLDFSSSALIASLAVGSVGLGIFLYGKRQSRAPQLVAGIVLMLFPYFVPSAGWMLGIAGGIIAALWLAVRGGP
jgi:hypothetical protein